jgi:hypothetical protein
MESRELNSSADTFDSLLPALTPTLSRREREQEGAFRFNDEHLAVGKAMASSSPAPLRYAVLWHSGVDQPHYDLMFETSPGSALATWRSPVWPISSAATVARLRDHRAAFLSFQGALSGERGSVTQIATGNCRILFQENARWTIVLDEGTFAQKLRFQHERDDLWQAAPVEITD